MNMRVLLPAVPALRSGPGAPSGKRCVQASIVALAPEASLVFFDLDPVAVAERARLGGEIAGAPLPNPMVSTRLALKRGPVRQVLLLPMDAADLAGALARFDLDGTPVAVLDPRWLQSPLRDALDLVDGLTEDAKRRLLRLMLTTGASLLGASRKAGYAQAVRDLVALLGAVALEPASVCALGNSARLLSYGPVADDDRLLPDVLVALSPERVLRLEGFAAHREAPAHGGMLHLVVADLPGARLVGLGSAAVLFGTQARVQPLGPWLARQCEATQGWVAGQVARLAARDSRSAALAREIRIEADQEPVLALRHVSAVPGGVLVAAEVSDPQGVVAALRLDVGGQVRDIPVRAGRATAFVPLDGVAAGSVCELRIVFGSGRLGRALGQSLEAYGGEIPEGFAPDAGGIAALAQARLAMPARVLTPEMRTFGAVAAPGLAVVLPDCDTPDALRARLALLAAEPDARHVEIVLVATARRAPGLMRLLAEMDGVFGLACTVCVLPDDASARERLGAGLGVVRAPGAVVFGADVLPLGPGWVGLWRAALKGRRGSALVGGVLLGADGAVRQAEGPGGARPWTGLPQQALPARDRVAAARVPLACFGLKRAAIAAFLAREDGYPAADVPLVQVGRALGGGAAAVTLFGARCVAYGGLAGEDAHEAAVNEAALRAAMSGEDRS